MEVDVDLHVVVDADVDGFLAKICKPQKSDNVYVHEHVNVHIHEFLPVSRPIPVFFSLRPWAADCDGSRRL